MILCLLGMTMIGCDGWSLSQEETDMLYDRFIDELQDRQITSYYYGESQGVEEYYLRVNYSDNQYSMSDKTNDYEKYYQNGIFYTKDIVESITAKEEIDFSELGYLDRIDEMDQLMIDIFLSEDVDQYLIDIQGAGAPWGNDLIFEFDNQALIDSGYISDNESLTLRVYSECEFNIFEIDFRLYNNDTNLQVFLVRKTNLETLEIIYPDNLDSYGTDDQVDTVTTNGE